jgi:transposase
MEVEIVQVERGTLEAMIRGIVGDELKDLKSAILQPIDTTPLSDKEVAERLNISISTVTRRKRNGKLKTIGTPSGRMVRACDLSEVK